jgi:hypothetical protein
LVALAATGCGDDESSESTPMNNGDCMDGYTYTCFDDARKCSGTAVCRNGAMGACMCSNLPPPNMMDGAVNVPDGSMTNDGSTSEDGSVVMNDAMVTDDGSTPDPDAGEDAAPPNECGGSCVPEVPADFDGPFLTFIGGSDAPSCGGAYDDEGPTGGAGLVAPEADCSACTCNSGGTSDCATYVDLEAGGNNACAGGCSIAFNQECGEIDVACLTNEATTRVRAVVPAGAGSCTPSEQDPSIDAAEFAQLAHTCAPDVALTGAGCSGDDVCAPDGPFDGQYCVTREGTHDCPEEGYTDRHVFFGDIADTRSCSECSCDRNCDYAVELFADDNTTCMGAASATLSIASPNESEATSSCEAAPVGTGGTLRAAFSVSGNGNCAASGGEPAGTAAGADPITFCCLE